MAEPAHARHVQPPVQPDDAFVAVVGGGRRAALLLMDEAAGGPASLGEVLESRGAAVTRARGTDEGVSAAASGAFDLALFVVGPGSAVDVCRRLRARTTVPLIVVSPVDDEAARVASLELGADDYVQAPYSAREVAARALAVLRRTAAHVRRDLVLQDVEIRVAEHDVVVAGVPVELTAREFEVLRYLAERAGEVVSRQRLLADVWGMAFPGGTRTVDVHIAQLRRKLGRPGAIKTVRGVGYKALRFPGQGERSAPPWAGTAAS